MSVIDSSFTPAAGSYPRSESPQRYDSQAEAGNGRRSTSIFDTADTVEISSRTRERQEIETGPGKDVFKLGSSMRSKFEFLSKSKKDLDSHINAVLKRAGLKLGNNEEIRVETTAGGKIKVAGIEDKERRKKIEEALNREVGLNDKIIEHNVQYRNLSAEVKSVTQVSLDVLLYNQKKSAEMSPPEETSSSLDKGLDAYEVFEFNPDLKDFIKGMCEDSRITYNTSSKPVAEPEKTLKTMMHDSYIFLGVLFAEENRKFMNEAGNGGEVVDEEFRENFLWDLSAVTISVGSDGSIEIEGELTGDAERDEMGKDLIKSKMVEMMATTDDTLDVNLFEEAAERLIEDYELAFGDEAADDAVVMLEIGKGFGMDTSVRLSSPSKEAELDTAIDSEVNLLLADILNLDEVPSFEVRTGKDGKLSIANLPENKLEREQLLHALDIINANVQAGEDGDEKYKNLTRMLRHRQLFMPDGIDGIYSGEKPITESTITPYLVDGSPGVTKLATPKHP